MTAKFPTLGNYEDAWPLDVIFISMLKYCTTKRSREVKEGVVLSNSAAW
jgi:hypothetical protein